MPTPVIDTCSEFNVRTNTIRRERRKLYRRLPWGSVRGYAPICWDSNDSETVRAGFAARLFRRTPPIDQNVLLGFKHFVEKQVKLLPKVDLSKIDFEEWIESRASYNQSRKDQLRAAFESLKGGPPTTRQCSHIDSFVKGEMYPTYKYPRMINSRSDAWKAFAGPYISACENIVYSFFPEFIKHTPVPERPTLVRELRKAGRRYFATDFTAFESHFNPLVMDACENVLLKHLLTGWKHADLVCQVNAGLNRMRTRTGVRASLKGRRMSGDLWTSLGNGFTNLMLAKYITSLKGGMLEGYVEGDDGIFSSNVEITQQDYEKLGFTIKIEEVEDPTHASFCGLVFAESGEIIRDPFKFLQSFGWTLSFIQAGDNTMYRLLMAKSLSALEETPQCPIVGAMARKARELCAGFEPLYIEDGYHAIPVGREPPRFMPRADTRDLFHSKFGISPSLQIEIESLIDRNQMEDVAQLLPAPLEMQQVSRRYLGLR